MKFAISFLVVILTALSLRAEPSTDSGNFLLPRCRDGLIPSNNTFLAGACFGTIEAIIKFERLFPPGVKACPPTGITRVQAVQAVIKYLDNHPADLDKEFAGLAMDALRDAWPCPK